MALKDLLSKAKGIASDLAVTAKSFIPKTEDEKKAAAAEAEMKRQQEQEARMALPPLPTFDCPYGGCFESGFEQRLSCSCPQTQKCPEGKKLEFIKRTFYIEHDRLRHAARFEALEETLEDLEDEELEVVKTRAITEFAKIYYPNLANPALEGVYNLIERELSLGYQPETQHQVLEYFNQRGNVSEIEDDNIWNLCEMVGRENHAKYLWIVKRLIAEYFDLLVSDPKFFKWEDSEEFKFAIKAMCVAIDPKGCGEEKIEYREGRIYELFDSEGHVKPAGLGGPEVGETGDTIWNTVESWELERQVENPCSLNAFAMGQTLDDDNEIDWEE